MINYTVIDATNLICQFDWKGDRFELAAQRLGEPDFQSTHRGWIEQGNGASI
jgi:hypothetical protein